MKRSLFAFVTLAALGLSSQTFASGRQAPYFSGASYQGGQFVSWTLGTIEEARDFVYREMSIARQQVDRQYSGYYWTDDTNRAQVECRSRTFDVQGYGAQVFENAVDQIVSSNLSSCTIQITSSGGGGNDNNEYAPYYSVASYQGAEFLSWTARSIEEARSEVYGQMSQSGQRVDREASGYYWVRDYNRGDVDCNERRFSVQGYGADVFEEAVDQITRYNLTGCIVRLN